MSEEIQNARFSRLTLGTVQLGLPYGVANRGGQPDEDTAQAVLTTAARHGVNSYDTAAEYGVAEELLGRFIASGPQLEPLVTSKFKLDPDTPVNRDAVRDQIRRRLEGSLSRLGVPRLPVYMLHAPAFLHTHGTWVAAALRELIDEGLVGRGAVSVYGSDEITACLNEDVYSAIQIPMSVFDQRLIADGSLEKLRANGVLVFVRSVFLQGLFFLSEAELPQKIRAEAAPPLATLQRFAKDAGISIAQLAVAWVRDLPGVTSLVIGAERPDQIAENAELLACPPLDPELRGRLGDAFANLSVRILNPNYWR